MPPLPDLADAAADGLLLGAGLIMAIGAQNLYVLRQGLKRRFVFTVALACSAIDAALIAAGVGGVGTLIAGNVTLTRAAAWGGAFFAGGAALASFLWFFVLAYGARIAAPMFARPAAQRGLDLFVWVVMWSIASGLIWNEVAG